MQRCFECVSLKSASGAQPAPAGAGPSSNVCRTLLYTCQPGDGSMAQLDTIYLPERDKQKKNTQHFLHLASEVLKDFWILCLKVFFKSAHACVFAVAAADAARAKMFPSPRERFLPGSAGEVNYAPTAAAASCTNPTKVCLWCNVNRIDRMLNDSVT